MVLPVKSFSFSNFDIRMKAGPLPEDESERVKALRKYNILDSASEKTFDEIVALASFICQTPISTITLIDDHRQWFKSQTGLTDSETSRDIAFCAHAILSDEIMIVEDATLDERFATNPLVTGHPDIRFYAGMPLINPDGYKLGTICVIDTKPRGLTEQQNFALKVLSGQVMNLFELRRKNAELERVHEMHNRLLTIIGHDLRAPVNSINGLLLLSENYSLTLEEYKELIPRMRLMVDTTNNLLFNLLHWAKSQIEGEDSKAIRLSVKNLAQNIVDANRHLFLAKNNRVVNNLDENHVVISDKNMIDFVVRNLLLNSNKFMERGLVTLTSHSVGDVIEISIADTGPGIQADQDVFAWGRQSSRDGTQGEKGSGFGLPMSKDFVERLGGRLWFTASDRGTNFFFSIPVSRVSSSS